jgi:hypothetical protein
MGAHNGLASLALFDVALLLRFYAEGVTQISPGQVIRAVARITSPWVIGFRICRPSAPAFISRHSVEAETYRGLFRSRPRGD